MPGILLLVGLAAAYWKPILAVTTVVFVVSAIVARMKMLVRTDKKTNKKLTTIGFMHPDSGGGGGGERVLWVALEHLLKDLQARNKKAANAKQYHVVLYTNVYRLDAVSPTATQDKKQLDKELLELVKKQFNIDLTSHSNGDDTLFSIECLSKKYTGMLNPAKYPRVTLFLQSIVGALALFANVALLLGGCDVIVDTVGIPFTYPLFVLLCGSKVATYTHYPTISTDMIRRVEDRRDTYNNKGAVAKSGFLTKLKLYYYKFFAVLYRFVGYFPSVVMTNSSWTAGHIDALWHRKSSRVFPPVNCERLTKLPFDRSLSQDTFSIVSVGQFRPEKNHEMQIRAFAKALKAKTLPPSCLLHLVGGARNAEDQKRVAACHALCAQLEVTENVKFHVSCPYSEIVDLLGSCNVGLHAMEDEHFGIVVVEYIAAGCVPLAHNSAGPKADIVIPRASSSAQQGPTSMQFGELATTEEEFATKMGALYKLATSDATSWSRCQELGRAHAHKFSDAHFGEQFVKEFEMML